jgi:hypothetical protein
MASDNLTGGSTRAKNSFSRRHDDAEANGVETIQQKRKDLSSDSL